MAEIKVYNLAGKEVESLKIDDSVFAVPANNDLVNQIFVSIYANKRQSLADTKTRGERAGSGIKPWRQKGTGRARVGSVRTPVWRKGGVAFGPKSERNFKKKINKKMNAKAIAVVLSGKLRDGEIKVVEKMELKENKTKQMFETLKNLKIKGKTLIAFGTKEKEAMLTSRNLEKVNNIFISQINVFDMLNHKNLVLSKDSVKYLEEKYKK